MILRRAGARKRALLQIATRRDEVIPLWAGHPAAFPDHPTVKPTAMIEDALLDLTNRGDIVLEESGL